jgi:hypothetical protein
MKVEGRYAKGARHTGLQYGVDAANQCWLSFSASDPLYQVASEDLMRALSQTALVDDAEGFNEVRAILVGLPNEPNWMAPARAAGWVSPKSERHCGGRLVLDAEGERRCLLTDNRGGVGLMEKMTFGDALVLLKQGKTLSRLEWDGTGRWLRIRPPNEMSVPYLYQCVDGQEFVPWVAKHEDLLAEDWLELQAE